MRGAGVRGHHIMCLYPQGQSSGATWPSAPDPGVTGHEGGKKEGGEESQADLGPGASPGDHAVYTGVWH